MADKNKEIALVLSSGGARGMAHIGVINALEKHGYKIKAISGASMGALVGGIYAAGKLKTLEDWFRQLDRRQVLSLVDITISANGLVKGEKVIHEMEEMIPDRNIEDLEIPFCAVATDILNEEEILFESGKLYDAIRASISIPTVMTPHKVNGRQLVDGGVINPIPSNRVKRTDGDILVVSHVNARITEMSEDLPARSGDENEDDDSDQSTAIKTLNAIQDKLSKIIPRNNKDKIGIFNLVNRSTSLMLHIISKNTIDQYPPDILVKVDRRSYGTFDFYKAEDIIRAGEEACEKALEDSK
ncbi:MAG: patatin-like phospholipase family protein [Bacteroidota bacterium]